MKEPFDKLMDHLMAMTPEELVADMERFNAQWDDIPDDKDCKNCPHATEGQCSGMVTPCFDICHEMLG